MKALIIIAAGLLLGGPSLAQTSGGKLSALETRVARYQAHQKRLESRLDQISERIARLKQQRSAADREGKLEAALQESQRLAQKLTKLGKQLRPMRTFSLEGLRTGDRA